MPGPSTGRRWVERGEGLILQSIVQYKLDATPEPSDEEEESSDEEDDGFGAKKKEVDEDPAASNYLNFVKLNLKKIQIL